MLDIAESITSSMGGIKYLIEEMQSTEETLDVASTIEAAKKLVSHPVSLERFEQLRALLDSYTSDPVARPNEVDPRVNKRAV